MTRLKLSDWAALAEIIASGAVITSIVYLSIQVRENTNAVQAATFQELINASDLYLLTIAQDSTLTSLVDRAGEDPASLTPLERRRYFYTQRAFWRNMENAFFQRQRGLLGDAEWSVYQRIMCEQPDRGEQDTWAEHRVHMSEPFISFVEACTDLESAREE